MTEVAVAVVPVGDVAPAVQTVPSDLLPIYTVGQWKTEEDSEAALDDALETAGLWKVYKQVPGALVQPRPVQQVKELRIDRILTPRAELVKHNWRFGAIGIECKRSGIKVNGAVGQALDYSRAIWTLPVGQTKVWLDYVFVWPMEPVHGVLASIFAQNRIGSAHSSPYTLLQLKCGELNLISISRDRRFYMGNGVSGMKTGSR